MKHYRAKSFVKQYDKLPQEIKDVADKNYQLLRNDPHHPSLNLKKLNRQKKGNADQIWSVKVGAKYRALAVQPEPDVFVWFFIGTHQKYNSIIAS